MAHSYVSVIATAGQTDFPFNFTNGYLSESHIHVYVNGTEVSRTITGGVAIIAPVAEGAVVRVARQSPATPVITFEDGSILNKQNIDVQTIHNIMLAEEYGEAFTEGDSSGEGSTTFTGPFPPEDAPVSSTWYCTSNGLSYILLDDGDSTAWVESNPNYPSAVGESSLYVSKAGDTMTGGLRAPSIQARDAALGFAGVYLGGNGSVPEIAPLDQTGAGNFADSIRFTPTGKWLLTGAQGTDVGSLTRKDYVDEYKVSYDPIYSPGIGQVDLRVPSIRVGASDGDLGPGSDCTALTLIGRGSCYYQLIFDGSAPSYSIRVRGTDDNAAPPTGSLADYPSVVLYHTGNPPTALEVGAASIARVNELEATVAALLSRIEALEAR